MTVHGVWHVGFSVRDIEASIRFYSEGLGLTLVHRQSQDNDYTHKLVGYPDANLNIAQFAITGVEGPASGHVLELIEYVTPRGEQIDPQNNRIAAGHLAFEVDDMDATVARLRELGARFVSDPVQITAGINKGGRTVYLYDPDGVTLELLQPRRRMPEAVSP
ncbi:MAG TPA: VOC family protein [Jatrophihabitans sp.]|nr:VOC family protein [Jatrophihabitans sp.]